MSLVAIIAGLISYLPQVPGLIHSIEALIARGKVTGELPPDQADALTALSRSIFAQHATPAPPPPGTTEGPG